MTDSMTGWPAVPAYAQHSTHGDAPSTPQKGKREKEGQRHGDTATPQHQQPQRPRRHPSTNPPRLLWHRPPRGCPAADDLHHQPAPTISTDTATTCTTSRPACCTRSTVSDRDGHQHEEREREEGRSGEKGEGARRKSPAPRRQSHKKPNPAHLYRLSLPAPASRRPTPSF